MSNSKLIEDGCTIKYFRCGCGAPIDHCVAFLTHPPEDEWGGFETWVYMAPTGWLPWYKRVWQALVFVFTAKTSKVWYTETILDNNDIVELHSFLEEWLVRNSEYLKSKSGR